MNILDKNKVLYVAVYKARFFMVRVFSSFELQNMKKTFKVFILSPSMCSIDSLQEMQEYFIVANILRENMNFIALFNIAKNCSLFQGFIIYPDPK